MATSVSDPHGPTGELCSWATEVQLSQIPENVQERAKLILLDRLGCGLVGAHLPWSETAVNAILELEPPGACSVIGWNRSLGGAAATLLNSTFIQGFELDDWHPHAPLHSAALIIPALLAAIEHVEFVDKCSVSGASMLLAIVIGLEVGPRIGLGLGGADMLSRGWHSGAVFGGPAVAIAVSRLLGLSPRQMEWALGTACTQAGGLMSAQFGSMTKRMQHGGYTGIERILERGYGGFFNTFCADDNTSSATEKQSVFANFGTTWETCNILIKPYPLMAALHAPVDCIKLLQDGHGRAKFTPESVQSIKIEMGEGAHKHGGWKFEADTLEPTGAQMNAAYAVAAQLTDGFIVPTSFSQENLNRRVLHDLIDKTECIHQREFDHSLKTRVTTDLIGIGALEATVEFPKGTKPKLSESEIMDKLVVSLAGCVDDNRRDFIVNRVMALENLGNLGDLLSELKKSVQNILN